MLFACKNNERKDELTHTIISKYNTLRIKNIDQYLGRIKEDIAERGRKPIEVEVLKDLQDLQDLQDIVGHSEKAIASVLNNSFNERAKDSLLKYYIKQNEKFNTEYWGEGVEFIDSLRFNETSKLYMKTTSDSINQELMFTEIISIIDQASFP